MKFQLIPFVFSCLAYPSFVSATADGPDCFRVIKVKKSDVLNVRSKPDSSAKKIGSIPSNADAIENLGCTEMPKDLFLKRFSESKEVQVQIRKWRQKNYWCKIKFENLTGYSHGNYLGEGTCPGE